MTPWPQPAVYQHGSAVVWMAEDLGLSYECTKTPKGISDEDRERRAPPDDSKTMLFSAFERLKDALFRCGFVPDIFHGRSDPFEPDTRALEPTVPQVSIEESADLGLFTVSKFAAQEAYELRVMESGEVNIRCTSYRGGLHALTTLTQLFYAHTRCPDHVYTPCAPVIIQDCPRFEHRGINLDIARGRIYAKDVLRTINAMALCKLNRLHLHATDSQSWPLEIPALPALAKEGAYHQSHIWTSTALKDVQDYGANRGVDVYVEVDMPSQTGSIYHAYPNLITAYNAQPWEQYALQPPAGQLRLNSPDVPPFMSALLNDLLPRVGKYSSQFHVGGDELNLKAYELDPTVRSSDKAVLKPLLQAFYDHAFALLEAHSMTPVTWEEILLDWDIKLPESTIVQAWKSQEALAKIVSKGYRALFGPASHWYLDAGVGSWVDPNPANKATPIKPPFNDWNDPYKSWRQVYSYDPPQGVPEEHHHLVLGGEVHLWSELNDSVTVDGKLWPRSAAAAEVLWKGKCVVSEEVTRRLAEVRERLVLEGVAASVVQMEWCLKNAGDSLLRYRLLESESGMKCCCSNETSDTGGQRMPNTLCFW